MFVQEWNCNSYGTNYDFENRMPFWFRAHFGNPGKPAMPITKTIKPTIIKFHFV